MRSSRPFSAPAGRPGRRPAAPSTDGRGLAFLTVPLRAITHKLSRSAMIWALASSSAGRGVDPRCAIEHRHGVPAGVTSPGSRQWRRHHEEHSVRRSTGDMRHVRVRRRGRAVGGWLVHEPDLHDARKYGDGVPGEVHNRQDRRDRRRHHQWRHPRRLVRHLLRSPPGDRAAGERQGDGGRLSRIQARRCLQGPELLLRKGQWLRLLRRQPRRDIDGQGRQRTDRG